MTKQFLFSVLTCFILCKAYASTPPQLSNFRVENANPDRIYFDSSQPITASNAIGFIVSGNTIANVSVNASNTKNHYFTVDTPFTFWDNNTIRYEGGSNFKSGNQTLKQFTLQHIVNNIAEPQANNYLYVAVNGNDDNDGKTEANAFKTITKAVSIATAGTTIWVKAGDYGSENISLKSGEINAPIKLIGYKNTMGDINSMYFKYSKEAVLNASEMPLLDGGNRSTGTAIVFPSSGGIGPKYIIVENFQVKNYKNGFYGNGTEGIIVDNCLAKDIGTDTSSGRAFAIGSYSNKVRFFNNIAINSTLHNFIYGGSHAFISNCKSYGNDKKSAAWSTDYYFSLHGEHNISKSTYSLRDGNLPHTGHGFSIDTQAAKYTTEYNLVENHTGVNCLKSLALRGDKVSNNIVRKHEAYSINEVVTNGIQIRDGANNNIIEAAYIHDVSFPTTLATTTEVGPGTAYNNVYVNCVFSNFRKLIYPFFKKKDTDTVYDKPEVIGNKYLNCTIYNSSEELIYKDSLSKIENNEFINCNITGVKSAGQTKGWAFKNCNFYDGFTVDNTGDNSGNINENPNFINANAGNFKLNSDSPLKDKGLAVNELFAFDYDGVFRPQGNGVDIGAFEIEETLSNDAVSTSLLGYKLYPNPTSGFLHISKNNTDTVNLSLLNVSGAVLYTLDNITAKNTSINLSQYAKGIYFLKVESKQGKMVKKVILN